MRGSSEYSEVELLSRAHQLFAGDSRRPGLDAGTTPYGDLLSRAADLNVGAGQRRYQLAVDHSRAALLSAARTDAAAGAVITGAQRDRAWARRSTGTVLDEADFQRFLIGKLKDIREVVATASLDAASKSALMAAWTSLYDASKGDRGDADDRGPASVGSGGAPARGAGQQPELPTRAEPDCLLDSLLLEDPGLLADDLQVPGGTSAAIPSASSTPSLPNLGGATMPGGGATPALVPGVSAPGGLPLSGLLRGVGDEPELTDFDERGQEVRDPADYEHSNEPDERRADDREGADEDAGLGKSESPPQAPTTVTLPNGETVTAASPQLAAAIKAAASGTPIADAFQQQGIAIPLPGTAVANPVDPARISAGDVGVFTATPLPLALAKLFWTARFNTSQPCEGQTF
ncbi:hypothetical protein I113_03603 [Mycobacterium tuberculosis OFXR-13]|nr:hypothetical protein I113_03603 [Mycobacterium tuberculosis OFXR-13]